MRSVVAVKTRLLERLQARYKLADVQVSYQHRGQQQQREAIWFGPGTEDASQRVAVLTRPTGGRRATIDETLTIPIYVEARLRGGSQQDADQRAVDLFTEVDDQLREDPRIDRDQLPEVTGARLTGGTMLSGHLDDGHACRIQANLQVTTRIPGSQ